MFGISRQAVYQRQWRQDVRMKEKEKVINLVLQERMSLPRLGTRKLYYLIKPKLESQGIKMGRDGLFTCLRLNHMLVKPKKSYTKTTMSKHWLHKHPNLLKDIKLQYPEQVYVSDITYIKSRQKTHYLSLVTDAYSRKIVGYHLSDDLNAESVVNALKMAVKGRNKDIPLIHHSDRGLQYCSAVYQKVLHKYNITPSRTDGYDCYQNALAERVNGILKQELLGDICNNYKDLKLLVKHSIEIYNMKRPHLALNMKTPNFIHQKNDGYKSIGSYNILV